MASPSQGEDPSEKTAARSTDAEAALKQNNTTSDNLPKTTFPETDLDRGIVGWDGQDDPKNPQNFPAARKWTLLGLLSAITFVSPLASSMFAPTVSYVASDLHVTDRTLLSFSVSIFLIGYTVRHLSGEFLGLTATVRTACVRPLERDIRPPDRSELCQLVLRRLADRLRSRPKHRMLNRLPITGRDRRLRLSDPRRRGHSRPIPC